MLLKDGRLVEIGMTFDAMRQAYEHEPGEKFDILISGKIQRPVKPWHILVDLRVLEVLEAEFYG